MAWIVWCYMTVMRHRPRRGHDNMHDDCDRVSWSVVVRCVAIEAFRVGIEGLTMRLKSGPGVVGGVWEQQIVMRRLQCEGPADERVRRKEQQEHK